jgi:hypothetical protein
VQELLSALKLSHKKIDAVPFKAIGGAHQKKEFGAGNQTSQSIRYLPFTARNEK